MTYILTIILPAVFLHTLVYQVNHLPRTAAIEKEGVFEVNAGLTTLLPTIECDLENHR